MLSQRCSRLSFALCEERHAGAASYPQLWRLRSFLDATTVAHVSTSGLVGYYLFPRSSSFSSAALAAERCLAARQLAFECLDDALQGEHHDESDNASSTSPLPWENSHAELLIVKSAELLSLETVAALEVCAQRKRYWRIRAQVPWLAAAEEGPLPFLHFLRLTTGSWATSAWQTMAHGTQRERLDATWRVLTSVASGRFWSLSNSLSSDTALACRSRAHERYINCKKRKRALLEDLSRLSRVLNTSLDTATRLALLEKVGDAASRCESDVDVGNVDNSHEKSLTDAKSSSISLIERSLKVFEDSLVLSARRVSETETELPLPTWYNRQWLPALGAAVLLYVGSNWLSSHSSAMIEVVTNAVVSSRNFFQNYIFSTLVDIYETVRYDRRKFVLTTPGEVEAEAKALGQMVSSFQKARNPALTAEELQFVEEMAKGGEMGNVLSVYSDQIQQPIKNALFGDVIQLLLVQLQKTKLDVSRSLQAMDNLLKSNEINIQLLVLVPAGIVTFQVVRRVTSIALNALYGVILGVGQHRASRRSADHICEHLARVLAKCSASREDSVSTPNKNEGKAVVLCEQFSRLRLPSGQTKLLEGIVWECGSVESRLMLLEQVRIRAMSESVWSLH